MEENTHNMQIFTQHTPTHFTLHNIVKEKGRLTHSVGEHGRRQRPAEDVGGLPAERRSMTVACGAPRVVAEWSGVRGSRRKRRSAPVPMLAMQVRGKKVR